MSFKVGDKVAHRETGAPGTVEASNFAHSPARYLVSYTKDNGATYQDWFDEDHLRERAIEDEHPTTAPNVDPGVGEVEPDGPQSVE